jgi:hypothetical protein
MTGRNVGALVVLGPGTHTVVAAVTFDFDGDGTPDTVETTSYEIGIAWPSPTVKERQGRGER